MKRDKLWFPFEEDFKQEYRYDYVIDECKWAISEIDNDMHLYCGTEPGDVEVSIYRLLGWMAARGRERGERG